MAGFPSHPLPTLWSWRTSLCGWSRVCHLLVSPTCRTFGVGVVVQLQAYFHPLYKAYFPQAAYSWGSISEKKSWPHPGRTPELCGWALRPGLVLLLSSVAGPCLPLVLCGWALWPGSVSRTCPPPVLCGWALCSGLVFLSSSVAGLCVQALYSSCDSCAPWLGSVLRPCPPLVLLLAAPLNSVAGLCVQALSSSCPLWLGSVSRPCPPLVLCGWALSSSCPCLGCAPDSVARLYVRVFSSSCPSLGRAPELCGWSLWPGLLERSVAEQIAMSMPTELH